MFILPVLLLGIMKTYTLQKVACHKMECKWRDSGLNIFFQAGKRHLGEYRTEIESPYFYQIIDNIQNNPRYLFYTINRLLKVNIDTTLPVSNQLCNNFLHFFISKMTLSMNLFMLHLSPLHHSA